MNLIDIKIVNKSAYELPSYTTLQSAGMDLRANITKPTRIESLQRLVVPTGLSIQLPEGYEAQIRPRSGMSAQYGISVLNAPGTIDSDYRGEIGVILINLSNETYIIQPGDRIAQMVIARYEKANWITADKLDESARGTNGFGSTGKR